MSDSDDEEDEPAQLHLRKVSHMGGVNRVRACPQQQHVVATWGDNAQVQVRWPLVGGWVGGQASKGEFLASGSCCLRAACGFPV